MPHLSIEGSGSNNIAVMTEARGKDGSHVAAEGGHWLNIHAVCRSEGGGGVNLENLWNKKSPNNSIGW